MSGTVDKSKDFFCLEINFYCSSHKIFVKYSNKSIMYSVYEFLKASVSIIKSARFIDNKNEKLGEREITYSVYKSPMMAKQITIKTTKLT